MQRLSDRPINDFDENCAETWFWTDGQKVYRRYTILKGADPETFHYDGIFAKDKLKCFCGESWLKDADVATFRVLNYTFAIDKNYVFTITGKVKGADIETFRTLDDGKDFLGYNKSGIPEYSFQGYAKDKNNIYYHNFEGKPKIIRNADLNSFRSLGDTYFALDKDHVYGYGKAIKRADPESWKKLTEMKPSLYSKDDKRIFYGFWEIQADYDTFELVLPAKARSLVYQLAKDRNNCYKNGEIISADEFEELKKEMN